VAYLAGPGELAYFAQVSAVADAAGAAQPLAVPRWSCTIVEPAVDRALARLGVGLDDLPHAEALAARAARDAVPEPVRASLDDLRQSVREALAALAQRDAAAPGGALLSEAVVSGATRQIGFRLDRLERRLLAAAKRRGNDALRDLAFARGQIWPDGHPQERTLNFLPFLARYGDDLWVRMRAAAAAHAQGLVGAPPA
jgi:bacillithiol synthase